MASTEAELLHLVDRAEAGTLLAAEAQQLRAGIRRYATAERTVIAAFNAAKQVVAAVVPAFQQLGLPPEEPSTEPNAEQLRAHQEQLGACCDHARFRHWQLIGRCCATGCGCTAFVTN